MFSDILKITPKLDQGEMKKMEQNLSTRFSKIAKGFGKGLMSAFKGGGWVGGAIALLNKILNPLKDIQESMEKTLNYSGDVVANAKEFGTSAGVLGRLQAVAQAKGIDAPSLYMLINKFMGAVAQAKADPSSPSSVREYTGTTDFAQGFFKFIQNLKQMDKSQRILAEQSVFGEKQTLKIAEFIDTDFSELLNTMSKQGLKSANFYDKAFNKGDALADLSDSLGAIRNINENAQKANAMNTGMIMAQDKSEKERIARETAQLRSYQDIQKLADLSAKVEGLLNQGLAMVGKLISFVEGPATRLIESMQNFANSDWAKKVLSLLGLRGGK